MKKKISSLTTASQVQVGTVGTIKINLINLNNQNVGRYLPNYLLPISVFREAATVLV